MKKLIFSILLAGFAVAVNADQAKPAATPPCCAKAKTEAKAECTMAKHAKTSCPFAGKTCCKDAPGKVLSSPKASEQASK